MFGRSYIGKQFKDLKCVMSIIVVLVMSLVVALLHRYVYKKGFQFPVGEAFCMLNLAGTRKFFEFTRLTSFKDQRGVGQGLLEKATRHVDTI